MSQGAEAPKSLLGRELPTGTTLQEKKTRVRSCTLDSALFAGAMLVLTGAGFLAGDGAALTDEALPISAEGPVGLAVALVLGLAVTFALYFGLSYTIGESESRSVERRYRRLEQV